MLKNGRLIAGIAVLGLLLKASVCMAWGELGHEITGAIAEKYMTTQAKQAVLDIMGPESLTQIAQWPDAVRDDHQFDPFKDYHFLDIPSGKDYEELKPSERAEKNSYTVLERYPRLLRDSGTPRSVKMVALRYLVHVIGDVHQPLHIGNGVDMGANLCEYHWDEKAKKANRTAKLHGYWDTTMLTRLAASYNEHRDVKVKYYGAREFAEDLLKKHKLSKSEIKKIQNSEPMYWIKESMGIRSKFAYPDDGKKVGDTERTYCKVVTKWEMITDPLTGQPYKKAVIENGKYDSALIPILSTEFKNKTNEILEQQMIASGLRIAGTLNRIFEGGSSGPSAPEIFRQLLLNNSDPKARN